MTRTQTIEKAEELLLYIQRYQESCVKYHGGPSPIDNSVPNNATLAVVEENVREILLHLKE